MNELVQVFRAQRTSVSSTRVGPAKPGRSRGQPDISCASKCYGPFNTDEWMPMQINGIAGDYMCAQHQVTRPFPVALTSQRVLALGTALCRVTWGMIKPKVGGGPCRPGSATGLNA